MKGLKMLFEKRSVGVGKKVLLVYLAHVSAYVFPLLTLPYLSRSLGPDTYALVGVTQSADVGDYHPLRRDRHESSGRGDPSPDAVEHGPRPG